MNVEQMVASQRVRIEELEEELRQAKEETRSALMTPEVFFPAEWKLTRSQRRLLSAFLKTPILAHGRCFDAIALNRKVDADGLVKVQVSKLRKKIAPFGMKIINRWAFGYEMPPESVAILRASVMD